MQGLVITYDTTTFKLVYGDQYIDFADGDWMREDLRRVAKSKDGSYVELCIRYDTIERWYLGINGTDGIYKVESVNGTTPTDIDHLRELLKNIML